MKPATINTERQTITRKPTFLNSAHTWGAISSITLCSVTDLLVEITLVCHIDGQELFVKETQPGFGELVDFLRNKSEFPEDWYERVETGETFMLNVPFS